MMRRRPQNPTVKVKDEPSLPLAQKATGSLVEASPNKSLTDGIGVKVARIALISALTLVLVISAVSLLTRNSPSGLGESVPNLITRRLHPTAWMEDLLVEELLRKTPRATKGNEFVVFVSKFNGRRTDVKYGKSTDSPKAALLQALNRIQLKSEPGDQTYIKIDSLTSLQTIENFNWVTDTPPEDSGFAVDDWGSFVFIPEQVKDYILIGNNGHLWWAQMLECFEKSAAPQGKAWTHRINYETNTVRMDFFKTESVFVDKDLTVTKLFKGHQLFRRLTPSLLRESARMGGDHLARQTHLDEGTMVYRYRPRSDTEPDEDYNLTRHAGTAYAMAVLYNTYKSPQLLQALQASLDYLLEKRMMECPLAYQPGKKARCVVDSIYHGHRWTQLGVTSLTLLAMAEYMHATHDWKRYWDASVGLATWISGMQREDGSFVQDQDIENNHLDENSYVRYFPGEAAFAISRLWNVGSALRLDVDDSWKAVAGNAMDYIVNRESKVEDSEFLNDHWMMYSAAEMHPWHFTPDMLDFVLRTGRLAEENQVRHHDDPEDQDKDGTYMHDGIEDYQSLNSCAGATKSEGLCAVYPAIKKHSPEKAKMFLDSVMWGIRYQLQTQMRPEIAMYMKVPARSMGAFSLNILKAETRNDYTQHNIASILCLARIMEAEKTPVLILE